MSAIGAIAGGLSQFIQNLNPSGAASPAQNASSGSTTTGTSGHHHHGGGFAKIADAITSALQSAANGSGGSTTTDANQTITQALTKIFQNGSLGSTSAINDDSDSSQDASEPADTDPTSGLPASFAQTLKSFGVTAQQFQTDLTNAFKAAQQSGNVDISSVLKNFPPGSIVDAIG
jgi:hypothetical protein